MAVVEAKRAAVNLQEAADQGRKYAEQLDDVPYVFLANSEEILFWNYRNEAYPHPVSTFFKQGDIERRLAKRKVRVDPLSKPVDQRIADRYYQKDCIKGTYLEDIDYRRNWGLDRSLIRLLATGQ